MTWYNVCRYFLIQLVLKVTYQQDVYEKSLQTHESHLVEGTRKKKMN